MRACDWVAPLPWVLLVMVSGWLPSSLALTCKAKHPSLIATDLSSPVRVETFYSGQQRAWGFQISPDGSKILWIALADGRAAVHYRSMASDEVRVLPGTPPVRWAYWVNDSRYISIWADHDGDENYKLFVADSQQPNRRVRSLTNYDGVRVYFHQALDTDPPAYLVRLNRRNPALHDLVRIDIESGRTEIAAANDGDVETWVTDLSGAPVGRIRRLPDYGWIFEHKGASGWVEVARGDASVSLAPLGNPAVGEQTIWALSNRGRDRIALVELDLKTGDEALILDDSVVDVDGAWVDSNPRELRAAWTWPARQRLKIFDVRLMVDRDLLRDLEPYSIRYTSESRDRRYVVVALETDRFAKSHFLLDRTRQTRTTLARSIIEQSRINLSRKEPIRVRARDGLELRGYLTLPNSIPPQRLPTVLVVHGGPFSRDKWGYDAIDQLLANRGYAVVRVNFRGSTGYGRSFVEAARGEFARKMQTDLIDTVESLVMRGITDPDAVAIYGKSYGGYAALVGLTHSPEYFSAAVDIVGPSDLRMLFDSGPAYWRLHQSNWYRFIGNPDDQQDELTMASRSPINFIDRIQKPLLVVQGGRDVRVDPVHAERIVQEMRRRGLAVEYLLFKDEGHTFRKLETHVQVAEATERFLHRHLGGYLCEH